MEPLRRRLYFGRKDGPMTITVSQYRPVTRLYRERHSFQFAILDKFYRRLLAIGPDQEMNTVTLGDHVPETDLRVGHWCSDEINGAGFRQSPHDRQHTVCDRTGIRCADPSPGLGVDRVVIPCGKAEGGHHFPR